MLNTIQENPSLSQIEIARELEWKVDQVKYYCNKLKKKGFIIRVGSSQKGYWEIVTEKLELPLTPEMLERHDEGQSALADDGTEFKW
jgi:predicted transcriptional regulator